MVRVVEVACRQNQTIPGHRFATEPCLHLVSVDKSREGLYADVFRARDAAIILERLLPRRLRAGADEWVIADFQPLRRCEEAHADGIADDRIGERPGIDDQRIDAATLRGNGARQADGPGARYDGGFVRHAGNLPPLPAKLRNNIVAYMARRVRANKSLIKQRYHVAKVAFPDDADLARSLGVPVLYLAETAGHAVAEKLQRFRGQRIDRHDLEESGWPLALVECRLSLQKIADLCDPELLAKHRIAPDVLASRDFGKTQSVARMLHQAGYRGLRWWSALSGDWHTIVLFLDRIGAGDLEYAKPEPLTVQHSTVKEACTVLGVRG